jgi:hypothetical protein
MERRRYCFGCGSPLWYREAILCAACMNKPKEDSRVYPALVVNDYDGATYGQWIKEGVKPLETRMGRHFKPVPDLVICVGKGKSVGKNKGLAICMVDLTGWGMMDRRHEEAACIEFHEDRYIHHLDNWRYFSRDFEFAPCAVKRNFQGIFSVRIPDDVQIIPQTQIKSYNERMGYAF